MALDQNVIGMHVSSTGYGGMLVIDDPNNTVTEIKADDYWAKGTSETESVRKARESTEAFVRRNRRTSARGVPVMIYGSGSFEGGIAFVGASGRVGFLTGAGYTID